MNIYSVYFVKNLPRQMLVKAILQVNILNRGIIFENVFVNVFLLKLTGKCKYISLISVRKLGVPTCKNPPIIYK